MCSTELKFACIIQACLVSVACIVSAKDPDGSCSSCNCRFNNIQVLDQIIESKIANGDQHCMQYIYRSIYANDILFFIQFPLELHS